MARCGIIKAEEVSQNAYRHTVTNVLGGSTAGVEVEVRRVDLDTGDVMLLCSDGLTDMLSDEQISVVLQSESEPQSACERLVAEANAQGDPDNITAIVARFEAV
jgi:PPM family protein phosphatase